MKIALYIEDGIEQIVLTSESDTEKSILAKLHDGTRTFDMKKGSFYECRGGYVRYGAARAASSLYGGGDDRDESTMIVMRKLTKGEGEPDGIPD